MTAFGELPKSVRDLFPAPIADSYEIHEWRNAATVLHHRNRNEWDDTMSVLQKFRLLRSHISIGGGRKSEVAGLIDGYLYNLGWYEELFNTSVEVAQTSEIGPGNVAQYKVPTHKIDCFRGRVALEVEWNNKDPFFDRDLNNFRLLFELRALDVGVIITRSDELQEVFKLIGRASSFGSSTTHMSKLLPKIDGGGAGGCPVLVFGITSALYVDDEHSEERGSDTMRVP